MRTLMRPHIYYFILVLPCQVKPVRISKYCTGIALLCALEYGKSLPKTATKIVQYDRIQLILPELREKRYPSKM